MGTRRREMPSVRIRTYPRLERAIQEASRIRPHNPVLRRRKNCAGKYPMPLPRVPQKENSGVAAVQAEEISASGIVSGGRVVSLRCEMCGFWTNHPSWELCPNCKTPLCPVVDETKPPLNQIVIPRAELEELVKALEWANQSMDAWHYDETVLDRAKETAAKFRAKYLDQTKPSL